MVAMGDMADHILESGDADEYMGVESGKECRYCGQDGLQWVMTETGYRLVNYKGHIHSCVQYVPDPHERQPVAWRITHTLKSGNTRTEYIDDATLIPAYQELLTVTKITPLYE
jgi:hypothetical protein